MTISVTIPPAVAVGLAVAVALLALYLVAIRARWFSRLHRGFFYTFLLAVGGDGIMAVFGGLDEMPDHPRRAVRAALRMKALVAKINGERAVRGEAPIAIGIGIHTDDVIIGNIGSRRRLEYTVIGDGVNTCSRVEAANKEFGTTILITESTFAEVQDEFECRPMPDASLKGKTKIPRLYEVLSARAR